MSGISSCNTSVTSEWAKTNQKMVRMHPAWHGDITSEEARRLIEGKAPFTYLLHKGEEEHLYFITFVTEEGDLKHQFFHLELSREGWQYKNATLCMYPTVEELIPGVMHCDPAQCIPVIAARSKR